MMIPPRNRGLDASAFIPERHKDFDSEDSIGVSSG
jgi:hypothetical protein